MGMNGFAILQFVNIAIFLGMLGLSIYTLVLVIKCLRRGIVALDYYNAEKKAAMTTVQVAQVADQMTQADSSEDEMDSGD